MNPMIDPRKNRKARRAVKHRGREDWGPPENEVSRGRSFQDAVGVPEYRISCDRRTADSKVVG